MQVRTLILYSCNVVHSKFQFWVLVIFSDVTVLCLSVTAVAVIPACAITSGATFRVIWWRWWHIKRASSGLCQLRKLATLYRSWTLLQRWMPPSGQVYWTEFFRAVIILCSFTVIWGTFEAFVNIRRAGCPKRRFPYSTLTFHSNIALFINQCLLCV
jgi:hypothetical protein